MRCIRRAIAVLVVPASIVLAGCGGGDAADAPTDPTAGSAADATAPTTAIDDIESPGRTAPATEETTPTRSVTTEPATTQAPITTDPTLTEAEVAELEQALDDIDAFLSEIELDLASD